MSGDGDGAVIRVRCEELTKKGEPCKNFAVVGSNPPLCKSHENAGKTQEVTARIREKAKTIFIEEMREHGDANAACARIGFALSTVRDWKYEDPTFAEEWEGVRFENILRVEQSLFEMATGIATVAIVRERVLTEVKDDDAPNGVRIEDDLVVTKQTTKIERSVQAAALWLRGNDPARYRDSKFVQPPEPRRVIDEKMLQAMMSDPKLAAAMDAIYDADLNT